MLREEGVAEKPPEQPGGGTEPEKAVRKSGFVARGKLSPPKISGIKQ